MDLMEREKARFAEMKAEYEDLCAQRDAVNALNAPIEEELARVSAEVIALQARETALAAQIDANRKGMFWIMLKKRIGELAVELSKLRRFGLS